MKRIKIAILVLACVLFPAFALDISCEPAYAEGEIVLTVQTDKGKALQSFYLSEDGRGDRVLCYRDAQGGEVQLPNQGSETRLNYSSVNDYSTGKLRTGVYGPKVEDILGAAGISLKSLSGKMLTFNGDGYKRTLDVDLLFDEDRAFYGNITQGVGNGKTAVSDDPEKVLVPVLIDLNYKGTLVFGQLSSSDHTDAAFVQHMANTGREGIITVESGESSAWENTVMIQCAPIVKKGAELDFIFRSQTTDAAGHDFGHNYLYYTTDGTEPTRFSAIYNYNPKYEEGAPTDYYEGPKAPSVYGKYTIKVKMMGLGKQDSETRTLTYYVADGTIEGCKDRATFKTATYTYDGKAKKPTASIAGMLEGEDYDVSYRNNIKAGIATVSLEGSGNTEGPYLIGTISKTFTIRPAAAAVSKVLAGSKCLKLTVKNQKSSGISGYEISYKQKGTSVWKKKDLSASKTALTIKKLKKGKRYYVRARAYVKTSAGTVYGNYSKTKLSGKVK